jgi:hypothetical protein
MYEYEIPLLLKQGAVQSSMFHQVPESSELKEGEHTPPPNMA